MSRQKAQGTRHESWLVTALRAAGFAARRLAEGGSADEGDVEVTVHGTRWVLEAKARQSLNVQATLGRSRSKAAAVAGVPVPVAVVWKRLVAVAGYKIRQPVGGERVVVSMSLDDWLASLADAHAAGVLASHGGAPTVEVEAQASP